MCSPRKDVIIVSPVDSKKTLYMLTRAGIVSGWRTSVDRYTAERSLTFIIHIPYVRNKSPNSAYVWRNYDIDCNEKGVLDSCSYTSYGFKVENPNSPQALSAAVDDALSFISYHYPKIYAKLKDIDVDIYLE
jgi:hypothetical protein